LVFIKPLLRLLLLPLSSQNAMLRGAVNRLKLKTKKRYYRVAWSNLILIKAP